MTIRQAMRKGANLMGLDVMRLRQSPGRTMLGLANRNIRTVIDVGANTGQFARMASEFFPRAELYCFEPLDDPFSQLSSWAGTQRGRVRTFQMALGEAAGEAEMYLHEEHTPSSSLLTTTAECHELYPQTVAKRLTSVRLSTLDDALGSELATMSKDILLKLDTQGYEDRVLLGGAKILAEASACLLEVCIEPLYDDQADFLELTRLLHVGGFHYAGNFEQTYAHDGRVIFLDSVFLK